MAGNTEMIARRLANDARLRSLVDPSRPTHERWASSTVSVPTDDWPYLYLERRSIPPFYFLMFGILTLFSATGVRLVFGRQRRIEWHFFFLGAGFLLLEVQNISKLALLFGTTWTVNAIVISAVLIMIMLANYYVMRVRVTSLRRYYMALFVSLLINLGLPLSLFAALSTGLKEVLIGIVMGLPIFFVGVIFSTSFAKAENRASALAFNLLGAMTGGMLESLAFLVGLKALLIVALVLYLLALLFGRSPELIRGAISPQHVPG